MPHEILIVNGSPGRRHESRELLERAGYEVREIVSLTDAIIRARRSPPLAVVMEAPDDPDIPARFAKRLRRHPLTQDVPVLVLSLTADQTDPEEYDPAVSWLREPCPPRRLLEEVAYLTRPAATFASPFGTLPPAQSRK